MAKESVVMQTADVNGGGGGGVIPFRSATIERVETLPAESLTMTTSAQRVERNMDSGGGFIYAVVTEWVGTASTNVANVAFTEDAPWAAADTIVIRDVNGELQNYPGYTGFLFNLGMHQYQTRFWDGSALFSTTPGNQAAAGSFRFALRHAVALNRRSLRGLLSNQDRSQKYSIRTDLSGSGALYGTAPTNQPTVAINKFYENYSVPLAMSPDRRAQQQIPPDFGVVHFQTSFLSDSSPAPSSTVNHYLRRVGNTIRFMILELRAGTGTSPRNVAQGAVPTSMRFLVGNDTLFNESYTYRRWLMYERYGFDWPDGVLIYDFIHDFVNGSGDEIGDDYVNSQGLTNAQFQIAYPSGFTTGGSLRIDTDDLSYVQPVAS